MRIRYSTILHKMNCISANSAAFAFRIWLHICIIPVTIIKLKFVSLFTVSCVQTEQHVVFSAASVFLFFVPQKGDAI
jgi:hypothetical protein